MNSRYAAWFKSSCRVVARERDDQMFLKVLQIEQNNVSLLLVAS